MTHAWEQPLAETEHGAAAAPFVPHSDALPLPRPLGLASQTRAVSDSGAAKGSLF